MKLTPFFRSNISMGSATMLRTVFSVVKTKICALVLGAEGVGIIGLMSQVELLGMSLSSFSIGSGLSRMVSRALGAGDEPQRRRVLSTALTLLLAFNLVFFLGFGASLAFVSHLLFDKPGQWLYLIPVLFAVPIHALIGSFSMGVLFGHGKIREYSLASIAGGAAEFLLFAILVKRFEIAGVLWASCFGFLVWLLVALRSIVRIEPLRELARLRIHRPVAAELLTTGCVMSVSGVLTYLTNALIRAHFMRELGPEQSGIYHVSLVFSSLYMPLLTNGIWARLHPKVSAHGLVEETKKEWAEVVLFLSLFGSIVQVGVICFSGLAIRLLYTEEFLRASVLLPAQMAGDFFFVVSQSTFAVLLGRGRHSWYLGIWITFYALYAALAVWLSGFMALQAASLSYFYACVPLGLFCFGLFFWKLGPGRRRRNVTLVSALAFGVVLLAVAVYASGANPLLRALFSLCWSAIGCFLYFHPRTHDRLVGGDGADLKDRELGFSTSWVGQLIISVRSKGGWRRLLKNVYLDFRYGGRFLGGNLASPGQEKGFYHTMNTDYGVFEKMLSVVRIMPGDVITDVGCGKGRLFNYLLHRGLPNRAVGVEVNPEVARATRARLFRYKRIEIIEADILELPEIPGSVFFLFNPFSRELMERFRNRLEADFARSTGRPLLVYRNAVDLDLFEGRAGWHVVRRFAEAEVDARSGGAILEWRGRATSE